MYFPDILYRNRRSHLCFIQQDVQVFVTFQAFNNFNRRYKCSKNCRVTTYTVDTIDSITGVGVGIFDETFRTFERGNK